MLQQEAQTGPSEPIQESMIPSYDTDFVRAGVESSFVDIHVKTTRSQGPYFDRRVVKGHGLPSDHSPINRRLMSCRI